jgi:hypothetical protein
MEGEGDDEADGDLPVGPKKNNKSSLSSNEDEDSGNTNKQKS